jgi:hypothetical protein
MGRLAAYVAGEVGCRNYPRRRLAASARDRDGVGYSASILQVPLSPIPPRGLSASRSQTGTTVGFEGFEGGEPGARSQRPALNQCGSYAFAAISFRYTRGPAVRSTTRVSPGLARAIRRTTIRHYHTWAWVDAAYIWITPMRSRGEPCSILPRPLRLIWLGDRLSRTPPCLQCIVPLRKEDCTMNTTHLTAEPLNVGATEIGARRLGQVHILQTKSLTTKPPELGREPPPDPGVHRLKAAPSRRPRKRASPRIGLIQTVLRLHFSR